MTDKIRIVGAFGDGAVEKVQEFVKGLNGVESVSVLHDGIETYPESEGKQSDDAAAAEAGEGESTDATAGTAGEQGAA